MLIKKTLEYESQIAIEKAREETSEKKSYEFVMNLLLADEFSIAKIANFANVPEAFVRKVKKEIK